MATRTSHLMAEIGVHQSGAEREWRVRLSAGILQMRNECSLEGLLEDIHQYNCFLPYAAKNRLVEEKVATI